MPTADVLGAPGGWAAAHERRRRCAQPGCPNDRDADGDPRGFCPACALDADMFDRESRWGGPGGGEERN